VCVCGSPPDEEVEQEHRAADDSGRAALLVLGPGQRQPVVHVALVVHDGLRGDERIVTVTLRPALYRLSSCHSLFIKTLKASS